MMHLLLYRKVFFWIFVRFLKEIEKFSKEGIQITVQGPFTLFKRVRTQVLDCAQRFLGFNWCIFIWFNRVHFLNKFIDLNCGSWIFVKQLCKVLVAQVKYMSVLNNFFRT